MSLKSFGIIILNSDVCIAIAGVQWMKDNTVWHTLKINYGIAAYG